MSNAAILYIRLLRKIVRESAWRLGGADEIFLATDLAAGDVSAARGPAGCDVYTARESAGCDRPSTEGDNGPTEPVERDARAQR